MLGCVLWSWDLGGHRGPCGLLQSWPETSSPACLKICPASSITSWEDKQCPHSWMRWWIGPGLACSSHFCQKPEGCWGPKELMGAARAWAPACRSPEHRGEVTGTAAGGPRPQLPRDGSTCTLETSGFLLRPHSRRPHVSALLPHLSFQIPP